MALTTQTVTGTMYYPNGDPMSNAMVLFTLSGPAIDKISPATLPQTYVESTLDGLGNLEVDLWPNEQGYTFNFYNVEVTFIDNLSGKMTSRYLGRIQVPSSGGPYTLSVLLGNVFEPSEDWGFVNQVATNVYDYGIL